MSVIDFPNPPLTLNQSFTAANGATYKWNGTMWVSVKGTGFNVPTGPAGGDLAGTYPDPTIKANVILTGNPTAPTPPTSDNDTSIATTRFVKDQGYQTAAAADAAYVNVTGDTMTGTLLGTDVTLTGAMSSVTGAFSGHMTGTTAAFSSTVTAPSATISTSFTISSGTGTSSVPKRISTDNSSNIASTAWVRDLFTTRGQGAAVYQYITPTNTLVDPDVGNMGIETVTVDPPDPNARRISISKTDDDGFFRYLTLFLPGDSLIITNEFVPTTFYARYDITSEPDDGGGTLGWIKMNAIFIGAQGVAPASGTRVKITGYLNTATGDGPILGVAAGEGLLGGGVAGNVELEVDFTKVAALLSPVFTGNPTLSTVIPASDNDQSLATTKFVKDQGYQTVTAADTTYVNVAGDTMTGALAGTSLSMTGNITTSAGNIISTGGYVMIDRTGDANGAVFYTRADAGQAAGIYMQTGSLNRWSLYKTGGAEAGSNAGSDLFITSSDDAGAALQSVLYASRATGYVALGLNGTPAARLHVRGTDQTAANYDPAGSQAATIYAHGTGTATGTGGAVMFGDGFGSFAAIKGYAISGTGPLGDLIVSIRKLGADTTFTEHTRFKYDGSTLMAGTLSATAGVTSTGGSISTTGGSIVVDRTGDALAAYLYAIADAGQFAGTILRTGVNARWVLAKNNVAESGSNAGSDYIINSYTDAGALLGTPFKITRSTGDVTLTGALTGTTATFNNLIYGPLAATGSNAGFGGDGTNVGIRTYSGGGIYFQGPAGTPTYGYFGPTGQLNLLNNLVVNGALTGTTATLTDWVNAGNTFRLNDQPVLIREGGDYTALRSPLSAVNNITMGNTVNPSSYYTNDNHYFRKVDQSTYYLWMSPTGISVPCGRLVVTPPTDNNLNGLGVGYAGTDITAAQPGTGRMYMTGANAAHSPCIELRSGSVVYSTFEMYDLTGVRKVYLDAAGNSTFGGRVAAYAGDFTSDVGAGGGGVGGARLFSGGANNTGYLALFAPDGARRAYIGYGTAGGTEINYNNDVGGSHYFSGGQLIATGGVSTPAGWINDNGAGNTQQFSVTGTGINGAGILLVGNSLNGAPNKWLRSINGQFDIVNSAFNAPLFIVTDDGLGTIGRSPAPSSNNTEIATTAWVRANVASPGGDFMAKNNAGFVVPQNVWTTIVWDTVVTGNSGGWYSTSTGRFTPPAGRYLIRSSVIMGSSANATTLNYILRKNGTQIAQGGQVPGTANWYGDPEVEVLIDANGTDWFDVQATGNATNITSTANSGVFMAFPISGIKGLQGDPGVAGGGGDVPVGSVLDYAGTTAPAGWLLCQGQSVAVASYGNLHAAIGYTYGGSGGNFNLPDLRGRVIAGPDGGAGRLNIPSPSTVGSAGGEGTTVLSTAHLAAHAHTIQSHAHTASGHGLVGNNLFNGTTRAVGTADGTNAGLFQDLDITVAGSGLLGTDAAGSGIAHNNTQATMVMNKIIKT
jgi:microcystin-dependent protein